MSFIKDQSKFKLFFIFTIFLNTLNLQVFGITSNPLASLVILWGGFLIIYQLWNGEIAWKSYSLITLSVYLLCIGFGTYLNVFRSGASVQLFLLQGIIFFLLFGNGKSTTIQQIKKEMNQINTMVCILLFIASLVSIGLFMFNVSYTANGSTLGLVGNRLFGVYFNSNPASFLAIIVILFSIMELVNHTKHRGFNLVNIVVQSVYILLSNCRSALLILLVIILVFTYYFLFKRKQYHWFRQMCIAFGIAILFLFGSSVLKELLFLIPKLQGAVFEDGGRFQVEKIAEIVQLMRQGMWTNKYEIIAMANDISSGRVELYVNALHAWRENPIFGIGVGTFTETLRALNPESVIMQSEILHSHNLFLEVIVTGGLLGAASFGMFLLKSGVVVWESFQKYEYDRNYVIILLITLVVFVDFAGSMMDYGVFYVYTISSVLFWVYLGYLYFVYKGQKTQWLRASTTFDLVGLDLLDVSYHNIHSALVKQASILPIHWDSQSNQLKVSIMLDYGNQSYAKLIYVAYFEGQVDTSNKGDVLLMQHAILLRVVPQLELFGNRKSWYEFECFEMML